MLKVNNKKVIRDLAKTTYKANKKRNLLTIVAIFLTTFLLCTVISIGLSYWDTVSLRQQRMQGIDYDIELTEPRDDQVSTIRKMDNVKYAGLNVKCGIVSKYQDKELDKLKLYWLDDTCWKQQTIPALDYYKGSYPTKENEIMLSQSALRSIGIKNPKVGMELPFTYQTLAENSENNDTAKTFILSGWFMDYTGIDKGYVSDKFYQSTGVLQTDLTEGTLKISLKNPLYSENDIIEMQNEINLSGNQIIEADYDTIIVKKEFSVSSTEIQRNSKGLPQALLAKHISANGKEHLLAIQIVPPENVCKAFVAKQYKSYPTVSIHISDDLYQIKSDVLKQRLRDDVDDKTWVYSPKIEKWLNKQVEKQHKWHQQYLIERQEGTLRSIAPDTQQLQYEENRENRISIYLTKKLTNIPDEILYYEGERWCFCEKCKTYRPALKMIKFKSACRAECWKCPTRE